ncbi:hypothetical protein F511_26403 [Dorcoceras hygrometricum]|uniref:Uncharacterized protein n=1 Tax=Dorcoceras hygrometricum TaxID=472368 RepID=A0A2Z7A1A8_9LAMI|nr:hypothetical protein F511_26403 [Dorcoceras hygrometricum]
MGKLSPLSIKRKSDDDNAGNKRMKSVEAEGGDHAADKVRLPLSEVVSDCEERWFLETLREAEAGDIRMQVLVSQMYNSGYGVAKDIDKGKFWASRGSRIRTSVRKLMNKRPGYNESDSDTDELAGTS